MHGQGTYKWPDGRMYNGSYQNDKKDGFGVYIWVDGRAYLGNWSQGKQASERVYILPNGTVRKGLYDGNTRKEWLTITEQDQSKCKQKLEDARKEADEVTKKMQRALKEYSDIQKTEELLRNQHEKEEIHVAEIEQEVEQVVSIVVENQIVEEIVHIQQEEKEYSPQQVAPEANQTANKSEGQAASPAGEGLAADIQIDDNV